MILIMFGAPGVGKGSQATILSQALHIPHISTGDIFRENVTNGTELGTIVKDHMDNGQLVPDAITIGLILDRIRKDDCKQGFIIDGFPRTLAQAEHLEKALDEEKLTIDTVVNIVLDDVKIIDRITGRRICPSCNLVYHILHKQPLSVGQCNQCKTELIQRIDDLESTIIRRLQVYNSQTKSVLSYYRKKYSILDVVSKEDINATTQQVFEGLCLDTGA